MAGGLCLGQIQGREGKGRSSDQSSGLGWVRLSEFCRGGGVGMQSSSHCQDVSASASDGVGGDDSLPFKAASAGREGGGGGEGDDARGAEKQGRQAYEQ